MRKKSLQHNSFIVIQKFAEQHESGKRSWKKVLSPLVKRLKKTIMYTSKIPLGETLQD